MVASGYGAVDKVSKSGDTMAGPLVIGVTGITGAIAPLHYGYGDSDGPTGLVLVSSYPSDDVTGGTDGTARINLYSYQRSNAYSFGETIRNFLMRWDAKAMHAWYGPTGGTSGSLTADYDGDGNASGSAFQPWTWVGSHYEANDHASIHGHWEVEVPDSTGALQGRFAILFANTTTGAIGLDKTTVNTNFADFHVYCHGSDHTGAYQEQYFRLTGAAGFEKPIEWNNDNAGSQANRRWKLAANATAESGGNAGTDFELFRYGDTGTLLDTPFIVTRSSGLITIGGTSGTAGGVQLNRNTGIALQVTQTGSASTALKVTLADTSSVAFESEVSGDSADRFVVLADGTLQWGSGSGTRDANLYRSSAGHIKTDSWLSAVEGLLVNTTSVAGGVGVVALADAATTPTATPSGGGVLYSTGGVLHWLNSSGGDFGLLPGTAPRESDLSYAAWTYDPVAAANTTAPTSGTVYGALVQVRTNTTVSKVILGIVSTAGMSLTASENFVAIFDSTGARVGVSADVTSSITTSGELALNLTGSVALTPGFYWVAFLLNGTTPTLSRGEGGILSLGSGQSGASKRRFGTIATTQTSMPASFTPSSMSVAAAVTFWMALA